MGIALASNFDVKTNLALDGRTNKNTIQDRDDIPLEIRYDGLECYVKENSSLYRLTGGIENSNWILANNYVPKNGGTFTCSVAWSNDDHDANDIISDDSNLTGTVINHGELHVINEVTDNIVKKLEFDENGFRCTGGIDYDFIISKENLLFGNNNTAYDYSNSVIIGYNNTSMAPSSFIIGHDNTINVIDHSDSTLIGVGLKDSNDGNPGIQQIFGQYNQPVDLNNDNENIFIIGIGTSDSNRKNGFVLYPSGNLDVSGDLKLFAGTENEIPSLKKYIDNIVISANGLRYKENIDATSTSPGTYTPAGVVGDLYIVSSAGYINGIKVEIGDMIICSVDTEEATSTNYSTIKNNWNIIQTNTDIFNGATSSSAGKSGLVPTPSTGSQIKYLKGDGTWSSISQSDVSNLTTDLAAKAPKANPTFTGTVTLPSADPIADTQAAHKGYVDKKINDMIDSNEKVIKIPINISNIVTNSIIKKGTLIAEIILSINESYSENSQIMITHGDIELFNEKIDNVSNMIRHVYLETNSDNSLNINISNASSGSGYVYIKMVENIKLFD